MRSLFPVDASDVRYPHLPEQLMFRVDDIILLPYPMFRRVCSEKGGILFKEAAYPLSQIIIPAGVITMYRTARLVHHVKATFGNCIFHR